MQRILITFGGADYDPITQQMWDFIRTAPFPVDQFRVYDDAWLIKTEFYKLNRWMFERQPQHGLGFCSWKSFIIQHALDTYAQPGDVVMYLDADTYPIADFSCLFGTCARDGIMLFEEQGCYNREYIKQDCSDAMGLDIRACELGQSIQAAGRFQLFQKGPYRNQQLLEEWLTYSLNPMCQFHEGSTRGGRDHFDFKQNSCEQSVLSLLAFKYGIPLHRTPDQNGWPVTVDKPGDDYPQLFTQGLAHKTGDLSGSKFRNVEPL
jgi:hypothetical protein